MPLSNNSRFGVKSLTEAINLLPTSATQIRSAGLFAPKYLATTTVDIENKNGVLTLVKTQPRGSLGVRKIRVVYTSA